MKLLFTNEGLRKKIAPLAIRIQMANATAGDAYSAGDQVR